MNSASKADYTEAATFVPPAGDLPGGWKAGEHPSQLDNALSASTDELVLFPFLLFRGLLR